MTVPDEAVEVAARAYQDEVSYNGAPNWGDLSEERRQLRIGWMRLALAAAAPFIAAQAWGEGYRECYERQMYEPVPDNPYRSGT